MVFVKDVVNEVNELLRCTSEELECYTLVASHYSHRAIIALHLSSRDIHKGIHILIPIPRVLP